MTQSYANLQKQIAALQMQAEKARDVEKAGVIAQAKEAIRFYGIQPHELFGAGKSGRSATKSKLGSVAKYADGLGNEWVGRGPRPQWLREALDAGKRLEDFEAGRRGNGANRPGADTLAASSAAPAKKRKKKIPAKFRDGDGNTWTGRGSQPRWLRAALAAGRKLDDLRA